MHVLVTGIIRIILSDFVIKSQYSCFSFSLNANVFRVAIMHHLHHFTHSSVRVCTQEVKCKAEG